MNRKYIYFATLVLILAFSNWQIFASQQVLDKGTTMMLPLFKTDVLSGNYVDLRYQNLIPEAAIAEIQGKIVVNLDEMNMAKFLRVYKDGEKLSQGEFLLNYKIVHNSGFKLDSSVGQARIAFGSEKYFFASPLHNSKISASYVELRVAADGTSIIKGLASENREIIN